MCQAGRCVHDVEIRGQVWAGVMNIESIFKALKVVEIGIYIYVGIYIEKQRVTVTEP